MDAFNNLVHLDYSFLFPRFHGDLFNLLKGLSNINFEMF